MSSPNPRVVVVGGGLGGLAAACTLAARGASVRLFEARATLGGKAAVLEKHGFRFDMGPTILTLPSVLRRVLGEAGVKLEERLDLRRLDPQWRCFFEDGGVLDLGADAGRMAEVLTDFADADTALGYLRFLEAARKLHRISERFFFWRPVGGLRDTLDLRTSFTAATLRDLKDLRFGRTVAGTIRGAVHDPRVAQMLDHFTQYVGSSPFLAPAVLCGIADMQLAEGVWYPLGGTRAVPEALGRLAAELGVEVETSCPVVGLLERRGALHGIELADGRRVPADAVVSNMDSVRTHRELLPAAAARRFLGRRRYEPACSGVVLYLGLAERYEHLAHHNFVFSSDPEQEFASIYARGEPAPDPTCYVAAPSRTEPGVAPPGGEALYVLVHAPYLRPHHDWARLLPDYRRVIIEKLERCAGLKGLERRIVFEHALTPADIRDRYRVLAGAIYGLASHGRFLGAFKPGNRSPDLAGLYLAGGSAHPGPGMPMALMSGWIAADALARDFHLEPAQAPAAAAAPAAAPP